MSSQEPLDGCKTQLHTRLILRNLCPCAGFIKSHVFEFGTQVVHCIQGYFQMTSMFTHLPGRFACYWLWSYRELSYLLREAITLRQGTFFTNSCHSRPVIRVQPGMLETSPCVFSMRLLTATQDMHEQASLEAAQRTPALTSITLRPPFQVVRSREGILNAVQHKLQI